MSCAPSYPFLTYSILVSKMPHTRSTKSSNIHQNSDDESLCGGPEAGSSELAAMIAAAVEKQRFFIESQLSGLNRKLDDIKTDLANCTKDIQKLCAECNNLSKRMTTAEKSTKLNNANLQSIEAKRT